MQIKESLGWIWFDMDGTFADLYAVDGWLDDLIAHNTRPYEKAKMMYSIIEFIEILLALKAKGYKLGVISWSSKDNNPDFDRAVTKAKYKWLQKLNLDLYFDQIIVTPYGVRKADTCRQFGKGILVDDEKPNRDAWDLGETVDATKNIIEGLTALV